MLEPSPLTRRCLACGYRFESTIEVCPIDRQPLPCEDLGAAEIGSYRLVERLGEGGMGAVYRAVHRKLGRVVAIKVLQKQLTSDRGIINRFFHEARAANTIRHEHVIEVYDFVEGGDNVYFVMELLLGRDLHETIHRRPGVVGPMEAGRAVRVLEQVAAGLHATHARDIVHRDLKPENIFLCLKNGVEDFVKIIDFGIAKLDRPDGLSTVAGAVLGTPEYIAPEQARGFNIDGRADIYSLGCIAYEMLTRQQLFGGGTRAEILTKQIRLVPPPMRHYVPSLPAELDGVVMKALAKDPRARPQTPLLFAQSLARALGQNLHDPGAFHTLVRHPTVKRTRTTSGSLVLRATPAPGSRSLGKALLVGALVVTLFTVAVATGRRSGGQPASPPDTAADIPSAKTTGVAADDTKAATALAPAVAGAPADAGGRGPRKVHGSNRAVRGARRAVVDRAPVAGTGDPFAQ
jgi:serine/threonine protein kinase